MRRKLTETDKKLHSFTNKLRFVFKDMKEHIKNFKKNDKKTYKFLQKSKENMFEDTFFKIHYTQSLTSELLGITFNSISLMSVKNDRDIDFNTLKKDNSFYNYINIIFTSFLICSMEKESSVNMKNNYDYIEYNFMGKTNLILSYFLIKEENPTEQKLLNTLSFLFKNSNIELSPQDMTEKNKEKIRLITTGIKYEKETKSINNTNYVDNNKRLLGKFDLLQYLSTRITIKYITKQNNKHRFHKRPVIHKRRDTYRHYKNGNVVFVKGCIVNEGMVS